MRQIQQELAKIKSTASQLSIQQNETESVKEELQKLEDDAVVYRMIGPILVRQSLEDCRQTVKRRAEFIDQELRRIDAKAGETLKEANAIAEKMQ